MPKSTSKKNDIDAGVGNLLGEVKVPPRRDRRPDPVPDAEIESLSGEFEAPADAPVEVPVASAKPKLAGAGKTKDVTVRLAARHTRSLDRIVSDLRLDEDRLTSRSDIIRALIERFNSDPDLRRDIVAGL